MNEVILNLETGFFDYPHVEVTFDGTNIGKFFKDATFPKAIFAATVDAGDKSDLFDFASLVFTGVNQSVKRRALGQELMLKSVEAFNDNGTLSVKICR